MTLAVACACAVALAIAVAVLALAMAVEVPVFAVAVALALLVLVITVVAAKAMPERMISKARPTRAMTMVRERYHGCLLGASGGGGSGVIGPGLCMGVNGSGEVVLEWKLFSAVLRGVG